ncbi:hypothetical protein D3C81_1853460 [compost metagenome]
MFEVRIAAENNDLSVIPVLAQLFDDIDAIHRRHVNVRDHDIRFGSTNHIQPVRAVQRLSNPFRPQLFPRNSAFHTLQHLAFIIDDGDFPHPQLPPWLFS